MKLLILTKLHRLEQKNKQRLTSSETELELNSYVLWERPEGILANDSRPDKLSSHYRALLSFAYCSRTA